MKKAFTILFFVLISQSAGIIGSFFTAPAIAGWYAELNKPTFNPPSWIFAPVWISLYTLIGIASYLIWLKRKKKKLANTALIIFFIHLVFNALWSIIFFGLKNPMWAFFEIIILWVMVLALIIIFHKIDKKASYLLIPYVLWVSFATFLNFAIWILN
jgi:tryptophan-rich sensory protein